MSQLTTNTATIDELITIANNLPDAGSGGEDVTNETTEYTNLLDDLEDAVNALPDAGGGGSSVETCTVTFVCSEYAEPDLIYTGIINGVPEIIETHLPSNATTALEVVSSTLIYAKGDHLNDTIDSGDITRKVTEYLTDYYERILLFRCGAEDSSVRLFDASQEIG